MPHDVFISYSSIDKAAALAACATFEAAQIRCWIAPRDVAAGSEWAEEIINAIESAKVMVLIFSSNSNESRQVRREIELAVSRGLTVMPLRLEQIEPTRSMAYYMAGVHWIDALTPPLETHFKRMVGWIKPHLKGGPAPEPPGQQAKTPPPPRQEPPRPAAPAPRRSSSIFGDIFYELFGHKSPGGGPAKIRINEAARAIDAAVKLFNAARHDEAIAAYRSLIDRIEDANAAPLDLNLATALFNLGVAYRAIGRKQEAVDAYVAVLRRCGDTTDGLVEKLVAMAMNNRASTLVDMGRARESITIYDDLLQRFDDSINTDINTQIAVARLGRGVAFGAMNRSEDAVAAYDATIAKIDTRVFPKLETYVAMAMVNKGVRQTAMGRTNDALLTYSDVVTRFGGSKDAVFREQVAKALANGASILVDLKRYDEALAMGQPVIDGPRDTPVLVAMAALTMRNKVVALRDAKRKTDAAAAADQMLAEFGTSSDKAIAEHAAAVRHLKAGL